VEDARASMELFKRVELEWKTEQTKTPSKADTVSLKRQRTEEQCSQQPPSTDEQSTKRPRLDSDSMPFLSDNYWPDDIRVCWF